MRPVRIFSAAELEPELACLRAAPGPAPWWVQRWPAPAGWEWREIGSQPNVEFHATGPDEKVFAVRRYYDVVHFFDGEALVSTGPTQNIEVIRHEDGELVSRVSHASVARNDCPLPEVIFVAEHQVLIARPHDGALAVAQQQWFLDSGPDLGYEWITHALRAPRSQLILTHGFRVPVAVLTEDARELLGFLDIDPRDRNWLDWYVRRVQEA